jgi:2-polyprenyl-3-methyl-5-hydroxy-6-metoxy-1,4-benzoquinol methylase
MTASEWDEFAIDWDVNADVRDYSEKAYAAWAEKVAPAVRDLPQIRVLDFGCGTGLLAQKLAKQCGQIVAVDSSPKMIEVLEKKIEESGTNNILTLVATVDNQSFGDHPLLSAKFDIVVASSVCSFLPNYEETLCSLSTFINPSGWFVQWDWISDMPEERLRKAFEASGLAVRSVGQAFSIESREGSAGVVMGVGQKLS